MRSHSPLSGLAEIVFPFTGEQIAGFVERGRYSGIVPLMVAWPEKWGLRSAPAAAGYMWRRQRTVRTPGL